MYNVLDIVKFSIQYSEFIGYSLNIFHLQELLFYIQGFYFKFYNRALFNDDFEVWKTGVVIPFVFNYCRGGFDCKPLFIGMYNKPNIDIHTEKYIKIVVDIIAKKDLICLRRFTNSLLIVKNHTDHLDNIISKNEIRDYFCNI